MNPRSILLLGILLPAVSAERIQAQTLALNPTADSFVDSAQAGNNYGTAGTLGVAPSGAAKGEFDSFLMFNLSGVSGWSVQSITLQLTASAPSNALFNGNGAGPSGTNVNTAGQFSILWLQNNSWLEGTGSPSAPDTTATDLDFNNHTNYFAPATETIGAFSFNGATSGSATYTLPLTPDFLAAVEGGGEVTLYVVAATGSNINYLFNAENFTTPASRPVLTVSTVPEPGSLGLSAVGLLAVAGRRRRG